MRVRLRVCPVEALATVLQNRRARFHPQAIDISSNLVEFKTMASPTDKVAARKAARLVWSQLLSAAPAGQRLRANLLAYVQSISLPAHSRILAYLPLPDELDLVPVLAALPGTIYLPVTRSDGMDFHEMQWSQPGGQPVLVPGYRRVPGPSPQAAQLQLPLHADDLILVPCLGCNAAGYRLGRGGGYYDRWRERLAPARKLGVLPARLSALDFQAEAHDLRLDIIVQADRVVEL